MSEKKSKSPVTFDLKVGMIDAKGKAWPKNETVGEIIADFFAARRGGNARKQWGWALKLGEGASLTLDRVDFDEFKNLIDKEDQMLANMVRAQALEILIDAEKEADKETTEEHTP